MAFAFKTKNVAVYDALRNDIVKGKLKPGQKIVMSEVAKTFGISEIPVREAIRRLESEGLIEFIPHVGATVCKMDESEFIEIYLIRTELETFAARVATYHITPKDIRFLVNKNREMENAIKEDRLEVMGLLNKDFHLRLYYAALFPYLYKLICDLWEKTRYPQNFFTFFPERAAESVKEHARIIRALESKDAKLTERIFREHMSNSLNVYRKIIKTADAENRIIELFGEITT
jgi:DNA-binding GntR family transcriptional regulator